MTNDKGFHAGRLGRLSHQSLPGRILIALVAIASQYTSARAQSIHITNPSFEADSPGSTTIDGWTSSNTAEISVATAPASFFDGNQVASINNTTGDSPSIGQFVSGLDTSQTYVLDYTFQTNPVAALLTDSYGTQTFGAAGGGGYVFQTFKPTTSSGTLSFINILNGASAQVDSVSLRALKPNEVFSALFDPSFEGSSSTAADGSTNKIAGWTSSGVTGIAPNLTGAVGMADNGAIPDGAQVAYLRANGSASASLSQVTFSHSLTAGKTYELSFRYNASVGGGNFDPADMTVTAGGTTLANSLSVYP
jgi:hypothetical protein